MIYINTILNYLTDNWAYIIIGATLAIAAIGTLANFFALAADEQKAKIKKWLLYAVTTAETELGGGTGKLKLATVYDMFIGAFPVLKNFISVETFGIWVDEVLDEMRHLLETNEYISNIVNGGNDAVMNEPA